MVFVLYQRGWRNYVFTTTRLPCNLSKLPDWHKLKYTYEVKIFPAAIWHQISETHRLETAGYNARISRGISV